ncbi:MAG: hypothetical protein BM556_15065 [Bacteriovorax sp. MedPE-SWde]|nr:MAG: hypothetical protein BM556_15065 [Bacteriovorax sp. MedPE-SWde]
MSSTTIKLRKGKRDFNWDSLITSDCSRLEIISPSLEEIPDRFNELTNLLVLELHCPLLKQLPQSFYKLEKIELLKIKNSTEIEFTDQAYFPKLKTLQLAKLKLEKVPNWRGLSGSLEVLDLHGNELFDLPDFFSELKKLKRLNLDSNKFTTLPWEVEELDSLIHMSLDGNQFSEEERSRIFNKFKITI